MTVQFLPMGPTAALVEDLPHDPAAWSIGLRSLALPGVVDVVPGAQTVLVQCESARSLALVVERAGSVEVADVRGSLRLDAVTVPVVYDGADLIDVARATGLAVDDVVALHSEAEYEVAFCGFAPGFGYLRGLPAVLHLPRRTTPRTRVPAGSVAIAAEYTAVYPTASPGGWHLLGTTDLRLFDVDRRPPALLEPGMRVRFRPT